MKKVIAVDLDGTLIDLSVLQTVVLNDFNQSSTTDGLKALLFYGLYKTNSVTEEYLRNKTGLLELLEGSTDKIKVNPVLIQYLQQIGPDNILILATGSDYYSANLMCWFFLEHLNLKFDYVIASEEGTISVSDLKLEAIKNIAEKFTYIGNSYQDLVLWADPRVKMICVCDQGFWEVATKVSSKGVMMPNLFVTVSELLSQKPAH